MLVDLTTKVFLLSAMFALSMQSQLERGGTGRNYPWSIDNECCID